MAIITIGQGSFAGGKAVAERLSQRLGQPPFSREEGLARAARESGVQESELTRMLNAAPHFWQQAPGKRLAYQKRFTAVLLDQASARMNVTADGGDILITGSVGSSKALELILRTAGAVEGVKAVRCEAGMVSGWYR